LNLLLEKNIKLSIHKPEAEHALLVADQRSQTLCLAQTPHLDGGVKRGAQESVVGEGLEVRDPAAMSAQGLGAVALGYVPALDGLVHRAAQQRVVHDLEAVDDAGVAFEGAQAFAGHQVPDLYLAVPRTADQFV